MAFAQVSDRQRQSYRGKGIREARRACDRARRAFRVPGPADEHARDDQRPDSLDHRLCLRRQARA